MSFLSTAIRTINPVGAPPVTSLGILFYEKKTEEEVLEVVRILAFWNSPWL